MQVLNKKYWPHQINAGRDPNRRYVTDQDARERWCYDNLKSKNWNRVGTIFAFKRHEDAVLFALHNL